MKFLDVDCLEKMGVVEKVDDIFQFTLLGPVRALGQHPSTHVGPSSSSGAANDTAGPSNPAHPLPLAL